MRHIRFGRTDVDVPTVSLGTWGHGGPRVSEGVSVGWSGHDDEGAKRALIAAHRAGITHWDTADAYGDGHSETLIGEVWNEVPRRDVFLATKFGWVREPGTRYYEPGFMRQQCDRSLRKLKTDVIDLYYFHHCDFGPNDEMFDDALAVMRDLREQGKIRFIGLSDWDSKKIMKFIARVDPDVVQPYRNLVDDEYESSGLKKWVDEHDLGAWAPRRARCNAQQQRAIGLSRYAGRGSRRLRPAWSRSLGKTSLVEPKEQQMRAANQFADATTGVVYIHASPAAVCPHVEWALSSTLSARANLNRTAEDRANSLLNEPEELHAAISVTNSGFTDGLRGTALSWRWSRWVS